MVMRLCGITNWELLTGREIRRQCCLPAITSFWVRLIRYCPSVTAILVANAGMCWSGRSRSVILAAIFLHLRVPEEFPLLADAIAHVREKRALRPDEWHETPKQVLIDAAERAAEWVKLVEQDIAEKFPEIAAASAT